MAHNEMNERFLAHPKLSKYDPLKRIIYFDDFDEGINGWTETHRQL
jgi:hypothetical protein